MRRFFKLKAQIIFSFLIIFCLGVFSLEAAVDPVVVELHYQNGVKFYKRGLYERAIQEFEKTLSLDPDHPEARQYLKEVKTIQKDKIAVDAKKSRDDEELKKLYEEGTDLYQQRNYEGALEVFKKILELKPIDDFASFYKERCEILMARKLAKEKKMQEKERRATEKIREHSEKKKKREMEKLQRQAVLKQRQKIREKQQQVAQEISPQQAPKREAGHDIKESRRQQLQEKLEAKEEKIKAAQERRNEKIKIKEERAQERREAKEQVRQEQVSRRKLSKVKRKETAQELKDIKELFIQGVEHYGKREYEEAITSFKTVVEAESLGRKKYTNAAKRMMEKAEKRLKK